MVACERRDSLVIPITPPTPGDAIALAQVAAYLERAASEAAPRVLARHALDGDGALLASLRESLLHGANLCAGLCDLAAECASG